MIHAALNGLVFEALQKRDDIALSELLKNGHSLMQDHVTVLKQLEACRDLNFIKFIYRTGFDLYQEDFRLIESYLMKKNNEIVSYLVLNTVLPITKKQHFFEIAIEKNNPEIANLFKKGIDINKIWEPIFIKCMYAGYLDSVKYLIQDLQMDPQNIVLKEPNKVVNDWLISYINSKNLSDKLSVQLNKNNKLIDKSNKKTKI